MINETIHNTADVPWEVYADEGCHTAQAVQEFSELAVGPYIAVDKTRHNIACAACPPVCPPESRCGRSCAPDEGRRGMPCAWPRWNQYSVRSSRGVDTGNSCSGWWLPIYTGLNLLKLFQSGDTPTVPQPDRCPHQVEVRGR